MCHALISMIDWYICDELLFEKYELVEMILVLSNLSLVSQSDSRVVNDLLLIAIDPRIRLGK